MKSVTKKMKIFFFGILISTFITSFTSIKSQSNFIRNDNFDFRGEHFLARGGSNPDNFNLFIVEDSTDFRKFKLHINKNHLNLSIWQAIKFRVDMNNDGTWEQDWTTEEKTITYNYPNPSGLSAEYLIKIEIQYYHYAEGSVNRTKYVPVTILPTPRVYVDIENNSFIQIRDENPSAKIPVLLIEGFDPLNEKFQQEYYNLTWNLVNTDLYPNGYEVFILNFNDGGRDLRLNASVVMNAINTIHEICPNYQVVVAGLSMGGPIARYALAKAENYGEPHNVGLFVSYDSPQAGAHISPGLQDWIFEQSQNEEAIKIMQDNLKSVAAKQMLRYNTYDRQHIFYSEFYNEMNGLNSDGYPHQCYNTAVSNGNFQATWGKSQVGRHLLTLKINDELFHSENAVDWDCFTGSKINDITTRRYADIFNNPLIHVYYELEIIFNPAYQPTWSALDLTNVSHDDFGNLVGPYNSKFDSYVTQTSAGYHSDLTQDTRSKILYWLNLNFNIGLNYSLLEGGTTGADNYQVQILHGLPITVPNKTVNVNGKDVSYRFSEWSDGENTNPRTFYTSHDVSKTAIMKGSLVSNSASGFSTNSQRKIVRTNGDGKLHMVYESLGSCWYTISTDNGTTWQPEQRVNPYGTNAKGVSIAEANDELSDVYIVYQIDQDVLPIIDKGIILTKYEFGEQQWVRTVYACSTYTYDTKPVVAAQSNVVYVVYKPDASSSLIASSFLGEDGDDYLSFSLSNTTSSSINPSLAAASQYFYLAYQNGNTEIRYFKFSVSGSISDYTVASSGSGFTYNYNPCIMEAGSGARISWIGSRKVNPQTLEYRTVFKDPSYWRFWNFGAQVQSTSLNKSDDCYSIAWGRSNTLPIQFTDSYTLSAISTIGDLFGNDIQVSNGAAKTTMRAVAFNSNTAPYSLNTKQLYSVSKVNSVEIGSGREGVVCKDGAQFYFAIGDIRVNDKPIKFVEFDDTVSFYNNKRLNEYLVSEPFDLGDNSSFSYSVQFGLTDSAAAVKVLGSKDFIKFRVELVDDKHDRTIGVFDNIKYTQTNVDQYQNITYQVAANGIGNKSVRLRLVTETNFDSKFALTDRYAESSALPKSSFKQINFEGSLEVKEYALEQNYPNPFNPSTQINYQIKEDGFVTLKLYDILGAEIKTLVNEEKMKGRYEYRFDGSNLATGVYIYQLKVNDYVSSKKLMLVK